MISGARRRRRRRGGAIQIAYDSLSLHPDRVAGMNVNDYANYADFISAFEAMFPTYFGVNGAPTLETVGGRKVCRIKDGEYLYGAADLPSAHPALWLRVLHRLSDTLTVPAAPGHERFFYYLQATDTVAAYSISGGYFYTWSGYNVGVPTIADQTWDEDDNGLVTKIAMSRASLQGRIVSSICKISKATTTGPLIKQAYIDGNLIFDTTSQNHSPVTAINGLKAAVAYLQAGANYGALDLVNNYYDILGFEFVPSSGAGQPPFTGLTG